jgi:hypothetical protein
MKYLNKKIVLVSLVPALVAAIAFANIHKHVKVIAPVTKEQVKKPGNEIDSVDVELLKSLTLSINPVGTNYQLSGMITIKDGADSVNLKATHLLCISIKKGNDFYYRLGGTETLKSGDFNICVDNELKKVILYKTDRVRMPSAPINTSRIVDYITGEGYNLVKVVLPDKKSKISLINPYHISCKEFSVVFGTESLKALSFYSRLCNDGDPSNPKLDKEITFTLDPGLIKGNELLSSSRILIRKGKDGFVLTGAYKQFELVIMA